MASITRAAPFALAAFFAVEHGAIADPDHAAPTDGTGELVASSHASGDAAASHGHGDPGHGDPGHGDAGHGDAGHAGDHGEHHEPSFVLGSMATYFASFVDGHTHHFVGPGVFAGGPIVGHWLELEGTARYLASSEGLRDIPLDVLLKLAAHPAEAVQLFVGAGPALAIEIEGREKETHVGGGLATAAGAFIWFTPHLGLLAEGTYGLIVTEHVAHEVGGSLGIAYGF